MRGKAKNRCRSCPFTRITPACAGKRLVRLTKKPLPGDHPRVCGEKPQMYAPKKWMKGSPPRVRGKGDRYEAMDAPAGITPAYAGKRSTSCCHAGVPGDHPRVCGEKAFVFSSALVLAGSPPRVRGKAQWCGAIGANLRITPACAGKSSHQHGAGRWRRDHPRVCGEKKIWSFVILEPVGSPPRVRGKALR